MSIEKLDSFKIKKSNISFTTIPNKVVQNIKNAEALAIWVYLLTLPPDWKVIKEQLKSHFSFGDNKIKRIFSYLVRSKLLQYSRERFLDGRLGEIEINISCGENFDENEPFIALNDNKIVNISTGVKTIPVVTSGMETRRVENQTSGSGALQNIYKNIKEKKETKPAAQNFYKPNQELKQTAKEWGPGHETWDRLHGTRKTN